MTTIDYLIVGYGRRDAVIARLLQEKDQAITRAFMLLEKRYQFIYQLTNKATIV